jgi:hypothetical protein
VGRQTEIQSAQNFPYYVLMQHVAEGLAVSESQGDQLSSLAEILTMADPERSRQRSHLQSASYEGWCDRGASQESIAIFTPLRPASWKVPLHKPRQRT